MVALSLQKNIQIRESQERDSAGKAKLTSIMQEKNEWLSTRNAITISNHICKNEFPMSLHSFTYIIAHCFSGVLAQCEARLLCLYNLNLIWDYLLLCSDSQSPQMLAALKQRCPGLYHYLVPLGTTPQGEGEEIPVQT